MTRFLLCSLIFFCSNISDTNPLRAFIIWNVGQGLATTLTDSRICFHFDFGGEKIPIKRISRYCRHIENLVHLSHSDQDHISGLSQLPKMSKQFCMTNHPPTENKRKQQLFNRFPICPEHNPSFEYFQTLWSPDLDFHKKLNSNDTSRVIKILLPNLSIIHPGDSSRKIEKIWAAKLKDRSAKVLILGHHGSQTSTSEYLLSSVYRLRMAIASARKNKYGHPHIKVKNRLKKTKNLDVISTEDWGNIIFLI